NKKLTEPDGILAFDLETTGLDPREEGAAIRLGQLGDEKDGWAFPWETWSGAFLEGINRWTGPLVGHNVSFDIRWLTMFTDWKAPYERIHDTMIMAQIMEPHLNAGLKDLSNRHIDPKASIGQTLLKNAMDKQGWTWATVPANFNIYWSYGCIDTIITALLFRHYRADLKYPTSYELEMSARRIVSQMEDNGVRIDLPYCEDMYEKITNHVEEAKRWAQEA